MNISGMSMKTSNSIRGFGGLASGLDRDALIEGMTASTLGKINKQKQKKMLLQWEQAAIRNITDKLTSFADKYTSTLSSSTNLFSNSLWGRTQITALGDNSKYVSVSGSANTADTITILGVSSLAEKAQLTSKDSVSDNTLSTGMINIDKPLETQTLEGKTLEFKYGNKTYSVTLPTGADKDGKEYKYDTLDNVIDSIGRAFTTVELEKGKKLSDVVEVSKQGDRISFNNLEKGTGNTLELTGGTALEHLGFAKDAGPIQMTDGTPATSTKDITRADLIKETSFTDSIAGKSMTFTYNGLSKSIKMPTKEELDKSSDKAATIKEHMQKQLNEAFGTGRVNVKFVDKDGKPATGQEGKFVFETTVPGGAPDKSSILSISSSDVGMLGEKGAFKIAYGESNRVNLSAKVTESGVNGAAKLSEWFANNKEFTFEIDGGTKTTKITISKDDTMQDIIDRINKESDIQVSYQNTSDKFVFTSKNEGASGKIQFSTGGADTDAILNGIFGINVDSSQNAPQAQGKDAKMTVKFAGSNEEVEIIRGSNTIKMDGMSITLKGTFDSKADKTDPITFDSKVDNEKIVNTVKDLVKEFNEIIELINKEVRTKPNRDYQPLTDAQKKEMSESEIKAWDEKAKEGLLFNDNDIKGLANSLRFVFGSGDLQALEKIGLTVSSTASDNGKISLDEEKFKAALASDPEGVKNLFVKEKITDETGKTIQSSGIAVNMKEAIDKYAKTIGEPKGILIRRAGSIKSPASITRNEIYKQIADMDKRIAGFEAALKREQDRYIRQFTTLESLIAQMNSQSNALSQFSGGY